MRARQSVLFPTLSQYPRLLLSTVGFFLEITPYPFSLLVSLQIFPASRKNSIFLSFLHTRKKDFDLEVLARTPLVLFATAVVWIGKTLEQDRNFSLTCSNSPPTPFQDE